MTSPGFFDGGRTGHLNAITHPPQAGATQPPDGSEVSLCKKIKVLENESIFQKYQQFSCQKNPFSKKNFEKLNIFYMNFWIFRKIILKISIFLEFSRNPEKFPMNAII